MRRFQSLLVYVIFFAMFLNGSLAFSDSEAVKSVKEEGEKDLMKLALNKSKELVKQIFLKWVVSSRNWPPTL